MDSDPPRDPDRNPTDTRFARSLVERLSAGRFSGAAWAEFWGRAWRRAWFMVGQEPARLRSFIVWAATALALGGGVLVAAYLETTPAGRGELWAVAATVAGWYGFATFWALVHLGRIRTETGEPHRRFLIPNGLSYLRFALAPLVVKPVLSVGPASPMSGVLLGFVAVLVVSDALDGLLARGLDQKTPYGRVLDPFADLAFLTALAIGLHRIDVLPTPLFILILLRYPGALIAGIVLYIARGPLEIDATWIGKATTATVLVLCLAAIFLVYLAPTALRGTPRLVGVIVLYALVSTNLTYLGIRALTHRK